MGYQELAREFQLLITDYFIRISDELERVLDGLTIEDPNKYPAPGANSIGWLAWHLTRSHDRNLSELYRKQ
ncbi:DinB family protein [Chloroflexota bacterium]